MPHYTKGPYASREFRFGGMRLEFSWARSHVWITAFRRDFFTDTPIVVGPMELDRKTAIEIAKLFEKFREMTPVKKEDLPC